MADIPLEIKFTDHQLKLIEGKLSRREFSAQDWTDQDLESLRSAIRAFYRTAQKAACAYCKNPVSLVSANNCHIEHIAPKSKYRNFIFEPRNLCVICADCNEIKRHQETINEIIDPIKKGDTRKLYPRSSNAFMIVHPHFDDYDDHILILRGKYYLNKTKKGGFTIYACNLNRHLSKFGWAQEVTDDSELMALMTAYQAEPDGFKRAQILNDFKKLLLLS